MDAEFEKIYQDYYLSVYKYLLSLSKNESIAEEMTQETFYKVLKSIKKYDPKYEIFTWICSIAKNTYYSYCKKNKILTSLQEDIIDNEKVIIDKIIMTSTNEEMLKIVHSLDEISKEVFTLRVYGNLSFRQICNIFEKTENWARVTYYRSKIKIKEKINEEKL